jgi:CHAT domain-containing protein
MFSNAASGAENLAQALQRAAETLRKDTRNGDFSHPMHWAGFSIVGDGGAPIHVA